MSSRPSKAASLNPAVDAYIAHAKPFAAPILIHLRKLIHRGCPQVEEAIKWSRPFFLYRGVILCNISAFSQHCSFGFWGLEMGAILREAGVLRDGAMGSLGRITSTRDLPEDWQLVAWLQQAAGFVDSGGRTSPTAARRRVVKAAKTEPAMGENFFEALSKNSQASAVYATFSPSCKREYLEWIASARRPETRTKRTAIAIGWIAEGKHRNWKYQVS